MGLVSCSGARRSIQFPIMLQGNLAGPCRAGPQFTPQSCVRSEKGQEHVLYRFLMVYLLFTETCNVEATGSTKIDFRFDLDNSASAYPDTTCTMLHQPEPEGASCSTGLDQLHIGFSEIN